MSNPAAAAHLKIVYTAALHAEEIARLSAEEKNTYTRLRDQFLAEAGERTP
ncbi:hypothetical protein ACFXDJ_06865 [Streptomyces sp. NPDC059443]|uniref:hypothetical protein n=1 Tax=unclassified Streptomyces TaxID=2593676 RepID=UPI0036A9581B